MAIEHSSSAKAIFRPSGDQSGLSASPGGVGDLSQVAAVGADRVDLVPIPSIGHECDQTVAGGVRGVRRRRQHQRRRTAMTATLASASRLFMFGSSPSRPSRT
jgi:hypothetical protein